MKAPIDNLFGEHSYCDDFFARKDELKSSTYKPAVKIRNKKNKDVTILLEERRRLQVEQCNDGSVQSIIQEKMLDM